MFPGTGHSLVAACSTFSFASGVTGRWVFVLGGLDGAWFPGNWLAVGLSGRLAGMSLPVDPVWLRGDLRLCALTNRPTVFQSFS